ncbi:MAG: DNA primase [Spirochaetia bacterium]
MRIPDNKIAEISERTDIIDIVSNYVTLKRSGSRYTGLCPFHEEKTPSFSVTPERNMYYCFGCKKGGSVFNFLMEMEGINFPEAVKRLAEKAGVPLELSEQDFSEVSESKSILDLLGRVAKSFHYLLVNDKRGNTAREYLKSRGIPEEVWEKYDIGYAPSGGSWLYQFLKKKNYSDELLRKSGLFSSKNPGRSLFQHRLVFPITDKQGRVIGFGGRLLGKQGPKYINSPESPVFQKRRNLYGYRNAADRIRRTGQCYITEGYFDVIAMHMAGIENVCAPLGTALTEEQIFIIKRLADKVILVFDGDKAGLHAAEKSIYLCEKCSIDSEVCILPENMDPMDILQKEGPNALKKYVKYSINSFKFLVNSLIERYNYREPGGRQAILQSVFPYIDIVNSEVRKESFFQELADALMVEQRSIILDYYSRGKKNNTHDSINKREKEERAVTMTPELFLMTAVTANKSLFSFVRSIINSDDLSDENAIEVYCALEECYRNEEESIDSLFARMDNKSVVEFIQGKMSSEEFSQNPEKLVKDSVNRLKEKSLKKKQQDLIAKIKKLEKSNQDNDEYKDLVLEKMYLDNELKKLEGRKA